MVVTPFNRWEAYAAILLGYLLFCTVLFLFITMPDTPQPSLVGIATIRTLSAHILFLTIIGSSSLMYGVVTLFMCRREEECEGLPLPTVPEVMLSRKRQPLFCRLEGGCHHEPNCEDKHDP